jgi:hypothetical protein
MKVRYLKLDSNYQVCGVELWWKTYRLIDWFGEKRGWSGGGGDLDL